MIWNLHGGLEPLLNRLPIGQRQLLLSCIHVPGGVRTQPQTVELVSSGPMRSIPSSMISQQPDECYPLLRQTFQSSLDMKHSNLSALTRACGIITHLPLQLYPLCRTKTLQCLPSPNTSSHRSVAADPGCILVKSQDVSFGE